MKETASNNAIAQQISHRDFIKTASVGATAMLVACKTHQLPTPTSLPETTVLVNKHPAVSIVKIKASEIGRAVDLLGGIESVAQGKESGIIVSCAAIHLRGVGLHGNGSKVEDTIDQPSFGQTKPACSGKAWTRPISGVKKCPASEDVL